VKKTDWKSLLILVAAIVVGVILASVLLKIALWLIGIVVVLIAGVAIGFWLYRAFAGLNKNSDSKSRNSTARQRKTTSNSEENRKKVSEIKEAEIIDKASRKDKNA
jgi:uncharacterized membrane protein YfcA